MSKIIVPVEMVVREWKTFQDRFMPENEMHKLGPSFKAIYDSLPDQEKRNWNQLEALVLRLLDCNGEQIADIYSEIPLKLKHLLLFRFVRISSFVENIASLGKGFEIPEESDPQEALYTLFRNFLLHPA